MRILKTCPYCGGHGYINQFEDIEGGCRAWANECIACKGTGAILVPETNANRIRRMSDEELAVFLESSRGCPSDDDCEYGVHATPENCIKHWTTWLQQPAKEDT